jgi:hypothetical protein
MFRSKLVAVVQKLGCLREVRGWCGNVLELCFLVGNYCFFNNLAFFPGPAHLIFNKTGLTLCMMGGV